MNVSCALELVTWFCLNVGCVWFKPTVLFCLNKVSERTHTLEHSHGGTIDGERNLTVSLEQNDEHGQYDSEKRQMG